MRKLLGMVAVVALVAACADEEAPEPIDLGGGTPTDPDPETPIIPGGAAVGDVGGLTFDGAQALTVTITLDADTDTATYTPDGTMGTYSRFRQQDEPTDRAYTAFAKTSTDGGTTAVVVSDGGQFNRFFGGARVVQNNYEAPTTGLASYGGDYAGLLNFGPAGVGAPAVPGVQPSQSFQVSGSAFLNADFNSGGQVNGVVYDRQYGAAGLGTVLPDIILTPGVINADGTFTGGVELNDADQTPVGSYGGVFGGANATSVGGVVDLDAGFLGMDQGNGNENEYGIFVLDQCTAASGPECLGSEGINE